MRARDSAALAHRRGLPSLTSVCSRRRRGSRGIIGVPRPAADLASLADHP